jgi:outer membrane receptor protein involved in Fe transport
MSEKLLFISLILFFTGFYLQSQTKYNITGTVVEYESNEALQYANLILSEENDSSLVAGTVTNEDGNFRFDNIKRGKYFITVSFIGFEKVETPVFELTGNIYVGKLGIKKLSILLDEVNVTSEKSTLVSTLDKKVYNVGKDIISESGSVSDILQNIPSVSVDVSGNVSIRGTSKITFLINGKSSSRLRRNAPIALQQIPAYTIERIEVITNPSAKYSPEGTGGIINIIKRNDSETGRNGQIIGNIGNEKKYNTSLVLGYGETNLSTLLSYSLRHPSGTNIFSDVRLEKDLTSGQKLSLYNENGSSLTKPLAHVLDAGVVYQLDDENNFEFSGNYFSQNSFHEGTSDINLLDNQNHYVYKLQSKSTNDESEKEGEGGISYEHLFGGNEDHSLTLEVAYSGYDEKEDLTFNELFFFPANESSRKKIFVNKTGNQYEIISEYALPINDESDFEAGYLGEFIHDNIYYNSEDGPNRFIFDQNLHSVYAIYSRDISKFNIELGLRGEHTGIKSHLVEPTDLLTHNDYFKFYPSFRLAYELDQTQNFNFSYGKRINRPEADQLNPFPEFIDPRNAEGGNPNLKPEQIYSLELSYQNISDQFTFTPALFYRYKDDAFTPVSKLRGDSTIIITTENLSNQQSAGIESIVSGKLFNWWDFDISTSLFYNRINATNLGYFQNKFTFSGLVELYSLFKLTKKTSLQLNLSYSSSVLTPQGQKEPIFYANIGYKQLLFYDQLSITFTISDIFDTYEESWNVNTPELNQTTKLYRMEPVFYIGASWRFGESYQGDEKQLEFEGEGLRKL